MKQKTLALLTLLITTLNGCAIEPVEEELSPSLIPSTVNETPKPDEHPKAETESSADRLWFHVRNQQQLQLIEAMGNKLKLDNNLIIEPVQTVEMGPKHTQLRFFTLQDKKRAKELLKKFKKIFPTLELLDLSSEYGKMIASGHFELWLAPDMKKINLPQPEVAPSTLPVSTLPPLSKP